MMFCIILITTSMAKVFDNHLTLNSVSFPKLSLYLKSIYKSKGKVVRLRKIKYPVELCKCGFKALFFILLVYNLGHIFLVLWVSVSLNIKCKIVMNLKVMWAMCLLLLDAK